MAEFLSSHQNGTLPLHYQKERGDPISYNENTNFHKIRGEKAFIHFISAKPHTDKVILVLSAPCPKSQSLHNLLNVISQRMRVLRHELVLFAEIDVMQNDVDHHFAYKHHQHYPKVLLYQGDSAATEHKAPVPKEYKGKADF